MTEQEAMAPASSDAEAPSMRIDPHVHTLASDGVDDVETILRAAVAQGLDAVAITDHERIDAAQAALNGPRTVRCPSRSSWVRRSAPAAAISSGST